jgi:hypothetical protein
MVLEVYCQWHLGVTWVELLEAASLQRIFDTGLGILVQLHMLQDHGAGNAQHGKERTHLTWGLCCKVGGAFLCVAWCVAIHTPKPCRTGTRTLNCFESIL